MIQSQYVFEFSSARSNGSLRRWNIFGARNLTNGSNQHCSVFARCSISTTFQSCIRIARISPSSLM